MLNSGFLKNKVVFLKRRYQQLHLLSVDTVIGACAGMYFFTELLRVSLGIWYYVVLALAVWAIYTLDHLLDVRFSKGKLLSQRHLLHFRHFKLLSGLLMLVSLTGLYLVWNKIGSPTLFYSGGALAIMMLLVRGIGVFCLSKAPFYKEVSIAFFYVAGISIAPILQVELGFVGFNWLYFVLVYWIIAFFNLLLLALLDLDTDRAALFTSAPSLIGVRKTGLVLRVIAVVGLILIFSLFIILPSFYHTFTLILLIMFIIHLRAYLEKPYDPVELRRKLEATFLLPAIMVIV